MLDRRLFTLGLVVTATGLSARPAKALQVSPMTTELLPSGPRSAYRMSVRNDAATTVTVEFQAMNLEVNDEGMPSRTDETADLIVFPPQSIIPPGREQLVNVRYAGSPQLEAPRMYIVRAAQLPVALSQTEAGQDSGAEVKIAFNVNTHVFVSPPDAKPEIRVSSVKRAENGDALISVHNDGSGFARMRRARYRLTDAAGRGADIDAAKIQLGQVSAVPPRGARVLTIPASELSALSGELAVAIQLE